MGAYAGAWDGLSALDLIPGSRTDFVTDAAHGGATSLHTDHGDYASSSSRIITQYAFNGESLTLNPNALASGPAVAGLEALFMDLLAFRHYGPPGASMAEKWLFYFPGVEPSAWPDLTMLPADTSPYLVMGCYDRTLASPTARFGVITNLSLTPITPPATLPEPSGCVLVAVGLASIGWVTRRRRVG